MAKDSKGKGGGGGGVATDGGGRESPTDAQEIQMQMNAVTDEVLHNVDLRPASVAVIINRWRIMAAV